MNSKMLTRLCFLGALLASGCTSKSNPPTVEVAGTAPSFLTYSQNPASYPTGTAIAKNVPTTRGGGASTYTVHPSLPAGLSLDPSSGIISGTPLAISSGIYTITASNPGGSTTAAVSISITAPLVCASNGTTPATDPGYRVIVYPPGDEVSFPAPTGNWQVNYQYTVPPLPCSATWNYSKQTFYIWGDIDFDEYGAQGSFPISDYTYNQITPQLSIGNVLSGNTSAYAISGSTFSTWIIQAQYFWLRDDGTPFAQTGPIINVQPGDQISTTIAYDASTGSIDASISGPEGTSSITIPRPFPNETQPLFSSWKTFFQQALTKNPSLLGRPNANVESHFVDQQTLCSVLPFQLQTMSIPNVASSSIQVVPLGSYSCPTPLSTLGF